MSCIDSKTSNLGVHLSHFHSNLCSDLGKENTFVSCHCLGIPKKKFVSCFTVLFVVLLPKRYLITVVFVLNGGKALLPHEFAEGIGRLFLYCIPYAHEKIEYNNSMYWKHIA